jgi:hypothetical protein
MFADELVCGTLTTCQAYVLPLSAGKDTCQGDSGGPMVGQAASGLSYEIIGITSFGFGGCANASYPGRYLLLCSLLFSYLSMLIVNKLVCVKRVGMRRHESPLLRISSYPKPIIAGN